MRAAKALAGKEVIVESPQISSHGDSRPHRILLKIDAAREPEMGR